MRGDIALHITSLNDADRFGSSRSRCLGLDLERVPEPGIIAGGATGVTGCSPWSFQGKPEAFQGVTLGGVASALPAAGGGAVGKPCAAGATLGKPPPVLLTWVSRGPKSVGLLPSLPLQIPLCGKSDIGVLGTGTPPPPSCPAGAELLVGSRAPESPPGGT